MWHWWMLVASSIVVWVLISNARGEARYNKKVRDTEAIREARTREVRESRAVEVEKRNLELDLSRRQREFDCELRWKLRHRDFLVDRGWAKVEPRVFDEDFPNERHREAEKKYIARKMKDRPAI